MMIEVLKSKLHCVRVTEANLNYMGSITIDEDLMDAANMIAGETVHIVDNPDLTNNPNKKVLGFQRSRLASNIFGARIMRPLCHDRNKRH